MVLRSLVVAAIVALLGILYQYSPRIFARIHKFLRSGPPYLLQLEDEVAILKTALVNRSAFALATEAVPDARFDFGACPPLQHAATLSRQQTWRPSSPLQNCDS